jgi:hypothetical protein
MRRVHETAARELRKCVEKDDHAQGAKALEEGATESDRFGRLFLIGKRHRRRYGRLGPKGRDRACRQPAIHAGVPDEVCGTKGTEPEILVNGFNIRWTDRLAVPGEIPLHAHHPNTRGWPPKARLS